MSVGVSAVVLLAAMAAAPASTTIVARRVNVTAAEAREVEHRVDQWLSLDGALTPEVRRERLRALALADATLCNGQSPCHAELGTQLKVAYLVLVSVSRLGSDTSVALELFDVERGAVVERESALLALDAPTLETPLQAFRTRVAHWLSLALEPQVEPKPPEPAIVTVSPAKTPTPFAHTRGVILLSSAVAALAAGVALSVDGGLRRSQLGAGSVGPDGSTRSALTGAQAIELNTLSALELGSGLALAALGLSAGTVGLVTW